MDGKEGDWVACRKGEVMTPAARPSSRWRHERTNLKVSLTDKHRHRTLSGIHLYEERPMLFRNVTRTTLVGKKTIVISEFELRDI